MRTRSVSRPQGFTLLEVLISTAIMSLVLGMAIAGFLAQNRSLQTQELARGASESARDAMLQLEGALRIAGWGVDPRFAIDSLYGCAGGAPCHDRSDGPDELVFVARNPNYRHRENGALGCGIPEGCYDGYSWELKTDLASRTFTVDLRAGQVLEQGRVLLATCQGGQKPVMVTLPARYEGPIPTEATPSPAPVSTELTLNTTDTPPYDDPASLESCHNGGGASLFVVDRSRYFVSKPDGTTPWLMLDTGVDLDGDGTLPPADTDDLVPIARNVEDIQVAYLLLQAGGSTPVPDSNQNWIVGDGAAAENLLANTATPAPAYDTKDDAAVRFTLHPGNVRGVRVTLTLRSSRRDPNQPPDWAGEEVDGAENRAGTLTGEGLRRYVYATQVSLRNMESKSPFLF